MPSSCDGEEGKLRKLCAAAPSPSLYTSWPKWREGRAADYGGVFYKPLQSLQTLLVFLQTLSVFQDFSYPLFIYCTCKGNFWTALSHHQIRLSPSVPACLCRTYSVLAKKKNEFLLFCARLFVTLRFTSANLLRLGKKKNKCVCFALDFP